MLGWNSFQSVDQLKKRSSQSVYQLNKGKNSSQSVYQLKKIVINQLYLPNYDKKQTKMDVPQHGT